MYPNLSEYLARSIDRSDYIREGTFLVYMRRGKRAVKVGHKPARLARALTVSNIHAAGREALVKLVGIMNNLRLTPAGFIHHLTSKWK